MEIYAVDEESYTGYETQPQNEMIIYPIKEGLPITMKKFRGS